MNCEELDSPSVFFPLIPIGPLCEKAQWCCCNPKCFSLDGRKVQKWNCQDGQSCERCRVFAFYTLLFMAGFNN